MQWSGVEVRDRQAGGGERGRTGVVKDRCAGRILWSLVWREVGTEWTARRGSREEEVVEMVD